jgi:hypothetical protein
MVISQIQLPDCASSHTADQPSAHLRQNLQCNLHSTHRYDVGCQIYDGQGCTVWHGALRPHEPCCQSGATAMSQQDSAHVTPVATMVRCRAPLVLAKPVSSHLQALNRSTSMKLVHHIVHSVLASGGLHLYCVTAQGAPDKNSIKTATASTCCLSASEKSGDSGRLRTCPPGSSTGTMMLLRWRRSASRRS